jgi:wyosine [tRNA(Phe)-imidazoG37] synthetase (radical SAM superfamily)
MRYLFGPVNSRRLGLSLGIDIMPEKICNFNCIYCEVGKTTQLTCERREYIPTADILHEIDSYLTGIGRKRMPDVFTVTGSGEPTLHVGIGQIIRYLKKNTNRPVAVLTNSSLMHLKEVREELALADIVIPSLDAAMVKSFRKINRPAHCVSLPEVIEGLRLFSREYRGQLWLEILLAKNINDTPQDIAALQKAIREIAPERIQLNSVARPPLEKFAQPVSRRHLEDIAAQIAGQFEGQVEIVMDFMKKKENNEVSILDEDIVQLLKRRPSTASDLSESLGLQEQGVYDQLLSLEERGLIASTTHNGEKYYQSKE